MRQTNGSILGGRQAIVYKIRYEPVAPHTLPSDAYLTVDRRLLPGDVPHAVTMQAILKATAMLRTTLYDGDAVSVREALHLGTPVIATDNGMRPEGVRLIAKSNLTSLLQAIEEEAETPSTSRKEPQGINEDNLRAVLDFYRSLL